MSTKIVAVRVPPPKRALLEYRVPVPGRTLFREVFSSNPYIPVPVSVFESLQHSETMV